LFIIPYRQRKKELSPICSLLSIETALIGRSRMKPNMKRSSLFNMRIHPFVADIRQITVRDNQPLF
jgi:hypothetical protein